MSTTPPTPPSPERRQVTVRRAPKFAPIMALGALLGFVAALIITYAGPGDPTLTRASVLGFFSMVLAIPGLLLGGLVALLLDRRSVKRATRATAERMDDDEDGEVEPASAPETGSKPVTGNPPSGS